MTDHAVEWSTRRRPGHLKLADDTIMSNFDHTIEDGAEQLLAETPTYGHYAGWDFAGYAWFEDGQFHCEVWQFQAWVATVSAGSLQGIMRAVVDRYGAD